MESAANSLWKWPEFKVLEIQKFDLKINAKASLGKKKKTAGTKIKGSFWNREPDNTSILNWI
jgi:hypothetical protein